MIKYWKKRDNIETYRREKNWERSKKRGRNGSMQINQQIEKAFLSRYYKNKQSDKD